MTFAAEGARLDALLVRRDWLEAKLATIRREIAEAGGQLRDETVGKDLSPRQRQVLDLVREKKINKEIGNELHISERTVKFHVSALLRIYGVENRQGL